jgi:hypothetical protein
VGSRQREAARVSCKTVERVGGILMLEGRKPRAERARERSPGGSLGRVGSSRTRRRKSINQAAGGGQLSFLQPNPAGPPASCESSTAISTLGTLFLSPNFLQSKNTAAPRCSSDEPTATSINAFDVFSSKALAVRRLPRANLDDSRLLRA